MPDHFVDKNKAWIPYWRVSFLPFPAWDMASFAIFLLTTLFCIVLRLCVNHICVTLWFCHVFISWILSLISYFSGIHPRLHFFHFYFLRFNALYLFYLWAFWFLAWGNAFIFFLMWQTIPTCNSIKSIITTKTTSIMSLPTSQFLWI